MNIPSASLQIAVLGGDLRQNYLANYFARKGHSVICFSPPRQPYLDKRIRIAGTLAECLAENTLVVGPVPFSRDGKTINCCTAESIPLSDLNSLLEKKHYLIGGNLPPAVLEECIRKEIPCYDFMQSDSLAHYNAELTAEGMLCEVLKNTPFALHGIPILILGYGRCGTALAQKFNSLGCRVGICEILEERQEAAISLGFQAFPAFSLESFLSEYSVIINTVPALMLSKEALSLLTSDVFLFDLASAPGGIDLEAAKEQGIPVFQCPGLPGKTTPLSAGEAIGQNILERIQNYG